MQFKSFMESLTAEVQESFGKGQVTIHMPGYPMHGKKADVFHRHDDGRVNVQIRHSNKRGDVSNVTLGKDQYKEVHKEEVELSEEHIVHVDDGSKYGDQPHKKDADHVMAGVKKHNGKFDGHSDKGAYFKFNSKSDAEGFVRHVKAAPHKTVYADLHEEIEGLDEAEVQARADYKLDKSGRKYHKQIHFKDGSNDEANEKNEVREATQYGLPSHSHAHVMKKIKSGDWEATHDIKAGRHLEIIDHSKGGKRKTIHVKEEFDMNEEMTDAQKSERERIVKGMKKNIAGFKAKYGERAKEVMYATATKQAMKEEAESLEEESGQHKVVVTVSDPNHPAVSQRKEQIMKRVIVKADHKDGAVAKAKEFYKKKGYKVHDAEYHSPQPKSTMKTEETNLEEEQLDELDKSTLKSYFQKSQKSSQNILKKAQNPKNSSDGAQTELKRKFTKRLTGMARAAQKFNKEEVEQIDERNKENATRRKMMDASRGARWKVQNKVSSDDVRDWDNKHKTPQAQNKAIGRALRNEEAEELDEAKKPDRFHIVDQSGNPANLVSYGTLSSAMKDRDEKHPTAKIHLVGPRGKVKQVFEPKSVKEEAEIEEGYRGNSEADKPYFDAQDHKAAAEQAHKKGDSFSYHMHMASHHDSLAHWSSNKGRHHVADQHAMKADQHHDWAQQARLKKEDITIEIDEEGNLMSEKLTYAQFMEQLLEYTPGPGGVTRVQGRSYGAQYHDPEGDDDADDKPKKKAEPAVKRGRGRPAGSKSGANQKVTSGKSYGGIATHSLHLPSSNR